MDNETKLKLKDILLRRKLNQFVSEDESEFARTCWRSWPKDYTALQTDEVHPETQKYTASAQPKPQPRFTPPQQNNNNNGRSRTPVPSRSRRPGPSRGRRG